MNEDMLAVLMEEGLRLLRAINTTLETRNKMLEKQNQILENIYRLRQARR